MDNSAYIKQKIREQQKLINGYAKNVKELQTILSSLRDGLNDEISDYNKELPELKQDLLSAVRHNNSFTQKAYDVEDNREKSPYSDSFLNSAIESIQAEINRISNLQGQAETKKINYNVQYDRAKEAEKAAKAKK